MSETKQDDSHPVNLGEAKNLEEVTRENSSAAGDERDGHDESGEEQDKQTYKVSSADKFKFFGLVAFILLGVVIGVAVVLYINSIGVDVLEKDLEQIIIDAGPFGVVICLLLQFIQIVVAFIPGEIVQLAIGYLYGTVWGGLITLGGAFISTVFVFYITRKLGAPFVRGMLGARDSKRLRFLHESKNLDSLIFILYFIPGMPKDLFNYIFPLTDVRPFVFFTLSTIGRAPAIFASTFVAASFRSGDYMQMAIIAIIFGGMGALGILFNQKIIVVVEKLVSRFSPRKRRQKDTECQEDGR